MLLVEVKTIPTQFVYETIAGVCVCVCVRRNNSLGDDS